MEFLYQAFLVLLYCHHIQHPFHAQKKALNDGTVYMAVPSFFTTVVMKKACSLLYYI